MKEREREGTTMTTARGGLAEAPLWMSKGRGSGRERMKEREKEMGGGSHGKPPFEVFSLFFSPKKQIFSPKIS